MGNTLQGNTVLLFGGRKDIAPHPVVQLGIDPSGQAQPMAVDAAGRALGKGAQSSAAPTNTAGTPFGALSADGSVFTLAAGETGFIQNHDDAVLNFKLGASCSTTSYSGKLKACSAAADGSGGYIKIENWIGVVSVAAATGTPSLSAWKI
jgi:hypothetical protein